MSHWVVSTTTGWNVGDDIIRQGVFNLMGIDPAKEAVVYFDRRVVGRSGMNPIFSANLCEISPTQRQLMEGAKGMIFAGTPEWANFQHELYNHAHHTGTPIYIIGAGMEQILSGLNSVNLACCTVRDDHAQRYLEKFGFKSRMFLDPAFHANYPKPDGKLDVVLNYRAAGDGGKYTDHNDKVWLKLYSKFRDRIELITAHEFGEYLRARELFPDTEVFFTTEPAGFQQVYANAQHYIGGRIHGAVQVVATGGTANLLYGNPKKESYGDQKRDCMKQARRILGGEEAPLRVLRYDKSGEVELFDAPAWRHLMVKDFDEHSEHVRRTLRNTV